MNKCKNLIQKTKFKKGYLPNTSFNAWTKYEVYEDGDIFNLEVVVNHHFFKFPESKQISIIIHELIHCSYYQMHAMGLITDEEAIALNDVLDNNFPTLYFVDAISYDIKGA